MLSGEFIAVFNVIIIIVTAPNKKTTNFCSVLLQGVAGCLMIRQTNIIKLQLLNY